MVMMSGVYCHPGYTIPTTVPAISSTDYTAIYLVNGIRLMPCPSPVPKGVPPGAMLSNNGVFISCRKVDGNTYQCDSFLAADGRRFNGGLYRCNVSDWLHRDRPGSMWEAEFDLEGGGICSLAQARK